MSRTSLCLAFASAAILLHGSAMAFTLQFGPYPAAHGVAVAQTTNGADVPTPQLLRLVISRDGVRQEAPSDFATESGTAPDVRFQDVRAAHTAEQTRPEPRTTTAHHLSGAEILLLRQANTVVDNAEQRRAND